VPPQGVLYSRKSAGFFGGCTARRTALFLNHEKFQGATMDAENFLKRIAASFVLLVVFCLAYLVLWLVGGVR